MLYTCTDYEPNRQIDLKTITASVFFSWLTKSIILLKTVKRGQPIM